MARLIREDYKRKLDNDFKTADKSEDEIQGVYAGYLCIRVSGFLESCIKEEISNFIENRCPLHIKSFIDKSMQKTTNLTHNKIKDILKSFSNDWSEYYESHISEEVKQSIGSLYDSRNSIAHGKSSTISLGQVKKHYENIQLLVDLIHDAILSTGK